MSTLAPTKISDPLTASRKAALLNLLTDEDPEVYQAVREKILSFGQESISWLRLHALSDDALLRRRSREIVQCLARRQADDQFLAFCLKQGEDFSLEESAWLLARTHYPEINIEGYQAVFDNHAAELLECVDLLAPAEQQLASFNEYFFTKLGFRGNEQNYYDPENSYLNRVVDRRLGNPISVCLVYLLLARRLRLPLSGIGLPGHFICRYQSTSEEFYIDVFNGGKLWTKANCIQYLLHGNYKLQDDYLCPVTPRRWLMRICGNLHQIYHHLENEVETIRFQRYLIALAR